MRITPPVISKYFDGIFLIKFPLQNPEIDIKNEAKPIKLTESAKLVPVSLIVAPETRASMLVAIPSPHRHFQPIH